jgi:hypothetical protein
VLVHRRRFVEAALKYRLPGIYWTREYVEEGGLPAEESRSI